MMDENNEPIEAMSLFIYIFQQNRGYEKRVKSCTLINKRARPLKRFKRLLHLQNASPFLGWFHHFIFFGISDTKWVSILMDFYCFRVLFCLFFFFLLGIFPLLTKGDVNNFSLFLYKLSERWVSVSESLKTYIHIACEPPTPLHYYRKKSTEMYENMSTKCISYCFTLLFIHFSTASSKIHAVTTTKIARHWSGLYVKSNQRKNLFFFFGHCRRRRQNCSPAHKHIRSSAGVWLLWWSREETITFYTWRLLCPAIKFTCASTISKKKKGPTTINVSSTNVDFQEKHRCTENVNSTPQHENWSEEKKPKSKQHTINKQS